MTTAQLTRLTACGLTLAVLILCAWSAGHAAPLITGAVESGTGLDPVLAQYTGQTFNHPNEGNNFTVPLLGEDVTAYTDRTHEYNGDTRGQFNMAQLGLTGAEYVMIANDNRGVSNYRLDVTVSATVDAYVFMDTRNTQPAWLVNNGFVDTRKDLGIDESGNGVGPGASIENRFNIWHKPNVPAGTFSTYERGGTGNNMYGVAVLAPGLGPKFDPPQTAPFTAGNVGLLDVAPAILPGVQGAARPPGRIDIEDSVHLAGNADAADKVWRWVQREFPASDWAARAGIKLGLAEAGKNNWMGAANNFHWLYEHSENYQSLGKELTQLAVKGKRMPSRDVTTGVILSAVLPGAGQAYSGRWGDAAAALVITGGLGTLAVMSYLDKQYVGAGVLGFLGITFYAGNIYNGGDAAIQYNRRQELKLRQEILDRIKQEKLEE